MSNKKYKIVIVGAGFCGSIVYRQIKKYIPGSDVQIFDKCSNIKDTEVGMGLNLNPNGLACLRTLDPYLEKTLRDHGLPRTKMYAETMTGEKLYEESIYDSGENSLALTEGLRIRWSDAYTVMRSGIPIQYNQEVIRHSQGDNKKTSVYFRDTQSGRVTDIHDIDLLIATDGRYSLCRNAVKDFEPTFIGVSNFRLLVPDTSGNIFEDMELLYNPDVDTQNLPNKCKDYGEVIKSLPRIGIMKMPAVRSQEEMLYIFGNFGIVDAIPESAKTVTGLLHLFTPKDKSKSSKKCKHVIDTLKNNLPKIHWARMQYTEPCFYNVEGNVLFLGDSAYATVPTLGQGATSAIEDACVASEILIKDIQTEGLDKNTLIKIEDSLRSRKSFISNVSIKASKHLMINDKIPVRDRLQEEISSWCDESAGFRKEMRSVWRGNPVIKKNFIIPQLQEGASAD